MAIILKCNEENLETCKNAILNGDLVSFPTETVFGLGANIFNEKALEKIFDAKGRPKSDPLIVHIVNLNNLDQITQMNGMQRACFDILSKKFWPGPLTLVVKASSKVSTLVTAGGTSIGLRMPSNKVAKDFLKIVDVPIAAPSANRFGHVSPTTAQHVYDDLGHYPGILILDSGESCSVGFESTVAKILDDGDIHILRQGAISSLEIKNEMIINGIKNQVKVKNNEHKTADLEIALDSPGQLLTHYSPIIESFILSKNISVENKIQNFDKNLLNISVIIDFEGQYFEFKHELLSYFDLSRNGNIFEAGRNLFSYLREAENIKGAQYILMSDLYPHDNEMKKALFDRVYRAASGKIVSLS